MEYRHVSVLRREVLEVLNPVPGKTFVDGTLGGGGHAREILSRILPDGQLIATDLDEDSVTHSQAYFSRHSGIVRVFHDNFSSLPTILEQCGAGQVHGILLDLGLSLHLLEKSGRGFSFQRDEPLDMRMDKHGSAPTAEHVINEFPEEELARIFYEYGEERRSRPIARRIVERREKEKIVSSLQLANIIAGMSSGRHSRIHPATRIYQALRIFINSELSHLESFLAEFMDCLAPGGRLAIISFHSLEDRMVKKRFAHLAKACTCPPDFPVCVCGKKPEGRILTRKVIMPSDEEVELNPMSRSAKLRAIEKLPQSEIGGGGHE